MKRKSMLITIIAFVEMLIGASTVMGLAASVVMSAQHKSTAVFAFVIISAWISFFLGLGLLYGKEWARILLVFFSGYIILTKALIFAGLLHFEGELFTVVSADLKNAVSIAYHGFVMIYFERAAVRKEFAR